MPNRIPSDECARAAEWVSLRLDRQLSDFEEVLLEAHLARCPDCEAVAASMIGLTRALRSTPLERPAFAFEAPRRARGHAIGLLAASAAAAAAVVGLSGLISLQISSERVRLGATSDPRVISLKERQMNELNGPLKRANTGVRPSLAERVTIGATPTSPARNARSTDFPLIDRPTTRR
jgi:ferric-dicitrate binding protein FerR (iron transport regulator)